MSLDVAELSKHLLNQQHDYWIHIKASENGFDKYTAKQHALAVAAQFDVSEGLIYLPGQPTVYLEDSDQPQPFRQRRYFYYLSGVDEPDCHLTYDIASSKLTLYIPPINPRTVVWLGRGPTIGESEERYDVDEVRLSTSMKEDLEDWIDRDRDGTVYILHPSQAPLVERLPSFDVSSLQRAVDAARVRKSPHEVKLIRKANDISASAHRFVLRNLHKFDNEAQIEAAFLDKCVARDAKHQAYAPIAASGSNASILHYTKNDEPLKGRSLVCLDAGCEWDCYASDVTRTFPIQGSWQSKGSKAIYDLVQLMQTSCIERMKPGVHFLDLFFLAQKIAIDGLLKLGILHGGTPEEIYRAGTAFAFFPHGLGHHLGLEVHDVSDVPLVANTSSTIGLPTLQAQQVDFTASMLSSGSFRAPCTIDSPHLEEGMVVTVEPGIYFSHYGLENFYLPSPIHAKYINRSVLDQYFHVGGVRIEDDILITADGYENLTTAPKGEAMLHLIQGEEF
ncbi:MAG: hypothetical protein M1827_003374 [Pycnora praestabilis]|nr:MAG: hypothetical protein M1827_003374 [Pycnora praestabilis]